MQKIKNGSPKVFIICNPESPEFSERRNAGRCALYSVNADMPFLGDIRPVTPLYQKMIDALRPLAERKD